MIGAVVGILRDRPAARWLAIGLAAAGAVWFEFSFLPRWYGCRQVALDHAEMESYAQDYLVRGFRVIPAADDGPPADTKALAAYHTRMRRKYERAEWLPFVLLVPDPPIPTLGSWREVLEEAEARPSKP